MKTGRNDSCPCGSGKKYKKCCAVAQANPPALETASRSVSITATRSRAPSLPTQSQTNVWAQYLAAGRYRELEVSARQLLQQSPEIGIAWKVLGLALWNQGKDALDAISRAAALLPQDAEAHSNLGNALRAAGRITEAVESHRRAIAAQPRYAEAHNNLGSALRDLGRLDEALAAFRRAVTLKPNFELAHVNLGDGLRQAADAQAAVVAFRRALELKPNHAEAHSGCGKALLDLGRTEEAVQCFQRAVTLNPALFDAHLQLGDALRNLWQLDSALTAYRRCLELRPDSAETLDRLGNTLLYLGQYDAAADSCRRATEIQPDVAQFHNNLGMVLMIQTEVAAAEASFLRALELNPRLTEAMVSLAELHADRGQFEAAEARLRQAIAIEPDMPEACAALIRWHKAGGSDEDWLAQAQRIVGLGVPSRREVHLQYALGKYFDDRQRYDEAFAHYRRANELSKQHKSRYDRDAMARQVDTATEHYDRTWIARSRTAGNPSPRPVFIVGMWRSGTTLAEQILASHTMAHGAGELPYWNQAAALMLRSRSEQIAPEESLTLMRRLADEYLQQLSGSSADALRVVDKMCSNFLHVGLIHAALPQARIIHLLRHPVDTCLSMYFQDFVVTHSYANDLEDLAHYYRQYCRIMQHWRETLDAGSMLEVPYEALVGDPETWTRRMLEFIGLPWDARCLEFHRTERAVRTVSKWQVRQRIHKGSVERWRNYVAHVEPLLNLLESRAESAISV
jgi:tetratricopeptide (TPR) repeat protein